MKILLLGTGSADGWPNPFCECASCGAERAAGRSRRPASALVDDVVLIDCGPEATHAASAAGRSLHCVEHVLITHGHPDHLDPAFLLTRDWALGIERQLHVWGPGHAIDLCRDWIAPGAPVELHAVGPGDHIVLSTAVGEYRLSVLPAAHSSGNGDRLSDEAVLFDLTGPDGRRLLYATDTGPLPDSTIAAISGAVEVLLVDETCGDRHDHATGHLDLATLPVQLASLRSAGVIISRTAVIATHLSHDNPPTAILRARLAEHGVHVPDDLDVIDTDRVAAPRRLLVLGGARSGKSSHAEKVAQSWSSEVSYVATGGVRPDDAEWAQRVAEHRARRPAAWTTVETLDVATVLASAARGTVVLVDCLTLWLTGQLDELDAWARGDEAAEVQAHVMVRAAGLLEAMQASHADVILVSNEVGLGVVPATAAGRLFRDAMGRVNAALADACDQTTFMIAGRAIALTEVDR